MVQSDMSESPLTRICGNRRSAATSEAVEGLQRSSMHPRYFISRSWWRRVDMNQSRSGRAGRPRHPERYAAPGGRESWHKPCMD